MIKLQELTVSFTSLTVKTTRAAGRKEPLTPQQQQAADAAGLAQQLRLDMSAARKAQGRKMVDQLKEQMSKLAVLSVVNPKAMAQILRMMSKQLASAMSMYTRDGDTRAIAAEADQARETAQSLQSGGAEKDIKVALQMSPEVLAAQIARLSEAAGGEDSGEAGKVTKELSDASLVVAADPEQQGRVIDEVLRQLAERDNPAKAAEDAKAASPHEAGVKAYASTDPERATDEKFLRDVRELRKRLEIMFKNAVERARISEKELPYWERLVADFVKSNNEIKAGEAAIMDWWKDEAPVALAAAPTSGTMA